MWRMPFLVVLFAISSYAGACENRAVHVEAPRKHFGAIKHQFSVISSLPYVVEETADLGDELVRLRIGYRWPGPQDNYPKPNALELSTRVYEILKPNLAKFAIRKISAEMDFARNCGG